MAIGFWKYWPLISSPHWIRMTTLYWPKDFSWLRAQTVSPDFEYSLRESSERRTSRSRCSTCGKNLCSCRACQPDPHDDLGNKPEGTPAMLRRWTASVRGTALELWTEWPGISRKIRQIYYKKCQTCHNLIGQFWIQAPIFKTPNIYTKVGTEAQNIYIKANLYMVQDLNFWQ